MQSIIILITGMALIVLYYYLGKRYPGFALLTCLPVASGFIIGSSFLTDSFLWRNHTPDPLLGLFAFGFVSLTLVGIGFSTDKPGKANWAKTLLLFLLLSSGFLLLVSFVCILAGGLLPLFGTFLWLLGSVAIFRAILQSNTSLTIEILSTAAAAMRQNLPLATVFEGEALSLTGRRHRTFKAICHWLSQGMPFSESLRLGFAYCPGYALSMIRQAERVNQLPSILEKLNEYHAQQAREKRRLRPINLAYLAGIIVFMCLTGFALMFLVVPKFEAIFSDIASPLPRPTQAILRLAHLLNTPAGWATALAIVSICLLCFFALLRPRRADKPLLLSRIGDFLKWHSPLFRWFEREHGMLSVIDFLGLSLRSGCTIDQAVDSTARLDTNIFYQKRVARWADMIRKGTNISQAARVSRVGSALAWAFDIQTNPDTLSALAAIEDAERGKYSYRINLTHSLACPLLIVILGCMAGLFVYSFFAPLVELLEQHQALIP